MFVNSWALFALAGVGLPLAVHYLTKPRPVRLPTSTLRFVRESIRQRRARHNLRDLIVLATRALAVAMVAFAVARPNLTKQPLISDVDDGNAVRVILIDASQSMEAVSGGTTAIQRARTTGASHLGYRPGLRANLVVAAAAPDAVFNEPSQNLEALRERLSEVQSRSERIDLRAAINLTAELLTPRSDEDLRRRELVVISDFQRSSWASADFSPLPPDTAIQFESTAPAQSLPNIGILRCGVEGRATVGAKAQLAVEVGNYSATPRNVSLEVSLCGELYRLTATCSAGRRTTMTQEISLSKAGWCTGSVRIVNNEDALAADDRRPLVVNVQKHPSYLLLSRQTPIQRPASSYYLEYALAPEGQRKEGSGVQCLRVGPAAIDQRTLASADLVVVDHPGKLSAEGIDMLAAVLQRGRPLLYVASESIDATNLKRLTTAAGLSLPVEFTPPSQTQQRRDLFLTEIREDSQPFAVFGDNTTAITSALRFSGGLNSQRRDDAVADDILASYEDGSACLVMGNSANGRMAVLNADLGRSNIATSGALVPLIDQLAEQLLFDHHRQEDAVCGELVVSRLPPSVTAANDLDLLPPAHRQPTANPTGELTSDGLGVVWRWDAPDVPGVYQVQRRGEIVHALALNVPADESQLEPIPPDVLTTRLAAGLNVHYRSADDSGKTRDVLWSWLLTACVVCMLGEFATLTLFRS